MLFHQIAIEEKQIIQKLTLVCICWWIWTRTWILCKLRTVCSEVLLNKISTKTVLCAETYTKMVYIMKHILGWHNYILNKSLIIFEIWLKTLFKVTMVTAHTWTRKDRTPAGITINTNVLQHPLPLQVGISMQH